MNSRTALGCLWFAGVFLASGEVQARVLEVGVGLGVNASAGWTSPPSSAEIVLPRSEQRIQYHRFSGLGLLGGLALEARFFRFVGVEIDVYYGRDVAAGTFETEAGDAEVSWSEPTLRLPILAKGIWPFGTWAPFVALGPEVVHPGLSRVEVEPKGRLRAIVSTEPSLWLVAALGVEWRVPIPGVDLRIPLSIRFSFDPSSASSRQERVAALPSDALVLNGALEYRLALASSAVVFF